MAESPNPVGKLLTSLNSLLDRLSEPNAKHFQDKLRYEIAHIRCKALLSANLGLLLVSIFDMLINGTSMNTVVFRCSVIIIWTGVLIMCCQVNPIIFNLSYTLCFMCYGPYIMDMEFGIQRALLLAIIFPLYQYVFLGDWRFFLFQIATQMIYVNKLYYPKIQNAIIQMNPEAFNRALTYSINLALVFCIVLVSFTHYFMQLAYRRIAVVEKKKDEVENQKTFLLGFSHELRNLINSLTGNVKLAALEVMTPKTKELLLNAEVCGELLLHLVNNILDTGKVEIGELEINPVSTRIYENLERVWGICSELIKRKNLGGKIRISKDLPKNLMIDHYRLTQIFLNLVGNSVKFTETGFIDISVEWLNENKIVEESCFQPYPFNYLDDSDEGLFEKQKTLGHLDKNSLILNLVSRKIDFKLLRPTVNRTDRGVLKIVVSDTGSGMSSTEIGKLFQKFTQVSSDSSKRKLGTGLGLFITKELCQRMKGDIKAFSQKEVGSSFIFCIPADVDRDKNDLCTQDIESLKNFVKSKNLKAMIVDDEPFNHTVLKSFFDKLDIKVINLAKNGLDAFHQYSHLLERGEPPEIITMDLEMPIVDGKEAARMIRKLEIEKGVRPCFMVIISANCSESEIKECFNNEGEIKANRFVKKPATLEELLCAVGHHFTDL